MRSLFVSFIAAGLVLGSSSALAAGQTATVTRVIDGDTIQVKIGTKTEKVRLLGIDTPETVDPRKAVQCFGVQASDRMKALLSGKTVTLVADPSQDRDIYKRLLRYVEIDTKDIGASLIQDGYAHSYKQYPHPRLAAYNALEKAAREGKKGLWGSCSLKASSSSSKKSTPVSSSISSAPGSCSIKGNISSKSEKIYHVKGCGSYTETQIDTAAGERWFCTEKEAVAAGWRKAGNCR